MPDSDIRAERTHKRVRAFLGGSLVADSTEAWMVWEVPSYPAYYVPRRDVAAHLQPTGATEAGPGGMPGTVHDVVAGHAVAKGAACTFQDASLPLLRDLVRLQFAAMDQWLEEDELVFVHPRDPYTRVDILASSRRVEVAVAGVLVAESDQPRILFETGLPPRYYLPFPHLRGEYLRRSDTVTRCPYKGTAHYWSVEVEGVLHEDCAWYYDAPLPESQRIAGLVCFYQEKADVTVDGAPLPSAAPRRRT